MNLLYLGDALDHWKGSLFGRLQDAELLRDFAVDAMASDAGEWQENDWGLLADLLRVRAGQIVRHESALAAGRPPYFAEITHARDLFLDPDVGVAPRSVRDTSKDASKYVFADEVRGLLRRNPERVVAVYQHVRGRRTRERVQEVVLALGAPGPPWCSYESPTVAMLFFSLSQGRIDGIFGAFEALLGDHAARRVYSWRNA